MTIKELQNEITNKSISTAELLRKAKILASKLKQDEFIKWVDKELNGYSEENPVPEYRTVKGTPQARSRWGMLPYINQDSKSQEILSERAISQSIPQLEELLATKENTFSVQFPPDIEAIMRKGPQEEHIAGLYLMIDRSEITGIVERARNKILQWCLDLENAGIKSEVEDFTSKEVDEAKGVKPQISIGTISGSFYGNVGNSGNFSLKGGNITPEESFWSKFKWLFCVALIVLVIGNIVSALILKYFFNI